MDEPNNVCSKSEQIYRKVTVVIEIWSSVISTEILSQTIIIMNEILILYFRVHNIILY